MANPVANLKQSYGNPMANPAANPVANLKQFKLVNFYFFIFLFLF
jgi:hypothetical protein